MTSLRQGLARSAPPVEPARGRMSYPGFLERTSTGYAVSLPDVPGCLAAGPNPTSALAAAQRTLAVHLEALVRDGQRPPQPGALDDLAVQTPTGAVLVLLDVPEPTLSERVNVWLPRILLERIDRHVASRGDGTTRSGFLAAAARLLLDEDLPRPRR